MNRFFLKLKNGDVMKLTPLRITLIYIVLGCGWIFFSDTLLKSIAWNTSLYTMLQTTKGWAFVIISGFVVYLLVKKSQAAIEKKDRMLNETGNMAKIGGWEFDAETGKGSWTNEVARIHDIDMKQLTNVELGLNFYHGEHRIAIEKAVKEAIAFGTPYELELELVTATGEKKWVKTMGYPIKEDGKVISVRGIIQDITESRKVADELAVYRKKLEDLVHDRTRELGEKARELEHANIRLQEIDRLKSVFLASMSHELRTPLNSIIGFTGVLLMGMSGALNDEQKKQLTMVKNSAQHLLNLINDILDISKIESGKVDLALEEFSLEDIIHETTSLFSQTVAEKNIDLLVDFPERITLFSDKRRVKQVIINLLNNAIKFTKEGYVKISCNKTDDFLELRVIDTGIGIKKEEMHKLFYPFQQIDESLTKKHEGTGLGLHLVKNLASLFGGEVSVRSEYGKGSEFIVKIPLVYRKECNEENTHC